LKDSRRLGLRGFPLLHETRITKDGLSGFGLYISDGLLRRRDIGNTYFRSGPAFCFDQLVGVQENRLILVVDYPSVCRLVISFMPDGSDASQNNNPTGLILDLNLMA
jgi:hypothetical protein